MPFQKLTAQRYPRRQWAIAGYAGSGKSTFAAQLATPILVIDADHRFGEVADLAAGDVYELSDVPADAHNPELIATILKADFQGSGVKTVVVDSLTSIVTPLVMQAILANDAGRNKNKVGSFKGKALAMRLLQDAVTATAADTLWIYHLDRSLDGQARQTERASISAVELARLRRSLNMQLRIVQEGDRRGIVVEWARRGRSGMTLWDESGMWADMPQRIEEAVYDGLTPAELAHIEQATPTGFSGPDDAIAWGYEQGCFRDAVHAQNAYAKLKEAQRPQTAAAMWAAWIADVQRRVGEMEAEPSL